MTSTHLDKRLLALLAGGVLMIAGCSGGGGTVTEQSASSSAPSSINPSDMTDQQAPPQRLVIDVTIKEGKVDPTNAQLEAKVKSPIVVRIWTDAADELHVHSNPEHTYKVEPNPDQQFQQFQFTVDVPGKVDIELHRLQKIIATVQVQP